MPRWTYVEEMCTLCFGRVYFVCCAFLCYAWDLGRRLSNSVVLALTVFELCNFKLKLGQASEEPEN